jgi:acetyltransferase-like isoleucine patch superfamily enzyme
MRPRAHQLRMFVARVIVWLAKPRLDEVIDARRMWAPLVYGDAANLTIDPSAIIGNATLNVLSGTITIGPYALFGQNVLLAAATHNPDLLGKQRIHTPSYDRDIVVEEGAWIASNATVMGPCRIGAHAVVAAGSVVTHDVPPYTLVAGVPARPIREVGLDARSQMAEIQGPGGPGERPEAGLK